MAVGTPIIAWPNGSVPEVVEEGRSGFLVESIDEAVAAVDAASRLPRAGVRAAFEDRFSVERMAQDYVALYEKMLVKDSPALLEPKFVTG